MALIGKIRQNFWVVLILLAMALASFVIMDVMGSRSGGGLFNRSTNIGEVAGQKIDYLDFEKVERALYSGSTDVYGRRTALWDYLQERAIVEKQVEKLGLGVSKEELMELQFGNNVSPIIQNNFGNPQTGQIDRQQLLQIKQAIETGQELNAEYRNFWAEQEKQIIKTSLETKINNLVSKGMIVPKWQAEVLNQISGETVSFDFVRVGYDKIPDAEVKLTDEDYKNFLAKNAGKYTTTDETRNIEYASFTVEATKEDSALLIANLKKLKSEFRSTTKDSLFAATNNGGMSPGYLKLDELTGGLKDSISRMGIGSVVGPYVDKGNFLLAKLIDKRVLPDSVKARHILKSVSPGNAAALAAARKSIDSLKNLIVSGRGRFDSLAIKNSNDGSSVQGGDLGTFAQGTMVKPFNDVCFVTGKTGGLYTVETQFGVHLIEILNQKFITKDQKYQIALIPAAIAPRQETQDAIYDKVSALLAKVKSGADLRKIAETNPDIAVQTTPALAKNAYAIPGFTGNDVSRSIIKWAFENDQDEVSPTIYAYQDEANFFTKNYVLASVKNINKPGLLSVEGAKASLEALVKNAKKAEILKGKIKSTDLNAIATEYATSIDTASNVSFGSSIIPSLQTAEPKIVSKAFAMEQGKVSGALEGQTGVFVIKTKGKTAASMDPSAIAMSKQATLASIRGSVAYRLWDAMKKKFKPTDNRSNFF
jgi:peptidyl-prolyl cis-trans isomerase D